MGQEEKKTEQNEAACYLVLYNDSFGPEGSPGIKTLYLSVLNKSIT